MATTVRVTEQSSRALDEMQARLLLLTRKRLSKQEVLQLVLEVGPGLDLLAQQVMGIKYPLEARARARIRRRIRDWGHDTRESDVNRALYGWRE